MKKILLFMATAFFAFATLAPGLGLGSFSVSAAPAAVADDPQTPPPPPQGVSPANPKMQPPDLDRECAGCRCCCCGAMCGGHMERGKTRFGRPELAPGDKGMMGPGAGCDRPHRSMMHQRATRERQMDRKEMCQGMAPGMGMGPGGAGMRDHQGRHPGGGVAAERMLRHAKDLDLSAEQTEKLKALAFETQKALVDLHAEIEKGQLELRHQLQSGSDDLGQIKSHLEGISRARTGIQEARIANLFEARKVLTEKQKKLIKEKFPPMGMIFE